VSSPGFSLLRIRGGNEPGVVSYASTSWNCGGKDLRPSTYRPVTLVSRCGGTISPAGLRAWNPSAWLPTVVRPFAPITVTDAQRGRRSVGSWPPANCGLLGRIGLVFHTRRRRCGMM